MEFYNIKDEYISFLRTYDTKVADNKHERRPYVGIVLQIAGIKYYAPFTSPKSKHVNMKNGKDFRKIGNGTYGAINFNNMIPVPTEALIHINILEIQDQQYKRLLQNQYNAIRGDVSAITKTATTLRRIIFTPDTELNDHDKQIKNRCCNLELLESVYMNYGNT